MNVMKNKRVITILVFLFCYVFIFWRAFLVPLSEEGKSRNAIHGDAYSDIHTHSAALFFKDYGFTRSCFLPVWDYPGNGDTSHIAKPYTHYPAVPDILAGITATLFQTDKVIWIRMLPVLLSVFFFFFIFYSLKNLLPDENAAFISAVVIVCSNYFIFWSDNLHKHLYEELLKWSYLFLLYRYYETGRKNKWLIFFLVVIYFLVTNVSFEPVAYLAVLTLGFSWIYRKTFLSTDNAILLLAPVAGFSLHLFQNYCYLGSWEGVMNDMHGAFSNRTLGVDTQANELHRHVNVTDYLRIPFVWLNRVERFFLFPGYALIVFAVLAFKRMRKESVRHFQIGIILLIATLSWSVLMTQHFTVHAFTGRHIGLFYAFVIGYGLIEYVKIFQKHWKEKKFLYRAIHMLFIGYIMVMLVSQQLIDIFRYGFIYPFI